MELHQLEPYIMHHLQKIDTQNTPTLSDVECNARCFDVTMGLPWGWFQPGLKICLRMKIVSTYTSWVWQFTFLHVTFFSLRICEQNWYRILWKFRLLHPKKNSGHLSCLVCLLREMSTVNSISIVFIKFNSIDTTWTVLRSSLNKFKLVFVPPSEKIYQEKKYA